MVVTGARIGNSRDTLAYCDTTFSSVSQFNYLGTLSTVVNFYKGGVKK